MSPGYVKCPEGSLARAFTENDSRFTGCFGCLQLKLLKPRYQKTRNSWLPKRLCGHGDYWLNWNCLTTQNRLFSIDVKRADSHSPLGSGLAKMQLAWLCIDLCRWCAKGKFYRVVATTMARETSRTFDRTLARVALTESRVKLRFLNVCAKTIRACEYVFNCG